MKTFFSSIIVLSLCYLQSCKDNCTGCNPPPPPSFIFISTFYTTSGNADLLDSATPGSFKEKDLKVATTVEQNGILKQLDTTEIPITIEFNNIVRKNYFYLFVPTNYGKNPLSTFIHLSSTITDTLTYTFLDKGRPYVPDKIYYNKRLVWDVENAPKDGPWPPITIVK
jgi:hypothetical protein